MKRYLEVFFRNPLLFLLPVILALAGAIWLARSAVEEATPYTAEATIAVNLDPTRDRTVGQAPISEQYAELLGELLETDTFVLGALGKAGSEPGLTASGPRLAEEMRSRWEQTTPGPNTIKVAFSCRAPTFCLDFMSAVLADFQSQVTSARIAQRATAIEFYQQQVRLAEERLRNIPPGEPARETARQTYESLLTRLVDAGLEEALAAQSGRDGFNVIAPPTIADPPRNPLRQTLLPLGLGLFGGMGLLIGSVAAAAWLDRSLMTAADVHHRFGLPTVAVVPRSAALHRLPGPPRSSKVRGGPGSATTVWTSEWGDAASPAGGSTRG